jgi:hypothetical protein
MDEIDLDKRENEVARARRAQHILEDPLVAGAFKAIGDRIDSLVRTSDPAHPEYRESLWHQRRGLDLFRAALTKHLTTGTLAATALDKARGDGTAGRTGTDSPGD